MRVSASVLIDQPIREVWAFATDPCCWTEWITGTSTIRKTWSGNLDVGATFRQEETSASHWHDSAWEVTEYEPPRVFACRRVSEPGGALRLLFEALSASTQVTLVSEEAAGMFVRGPEVERAALDRMERDLARLKQRLEKHGVQSVVPSLSPAN
ncbi:MAG TPA: SRPBCC family protein [Herpetosiphonaceae bacterium]|nr:SRPBCC family protein [Herpetosiphonaceae bacterium]